MTHQVAAQWHQGDVWIAEVEATYELKDQLQMKLRRAFVLRDGPDGFVDLHVYGAHERPFPDHDTGEQGTRPGGRWTTALMEIAARWARPLGRPSGTLEDQSPHHQDRAQGSGIVSAGARARGG